VFTLNPCKAGVDKSLYKSSAYGDETLRGSFFTLKQKQKKSIFIKSQIRKLFKGAIFKTKLSGTERGAWTAFESVSCNFLGNKNTQNYEEQYMYTIFFPTVMSLNIFSLFSFGFLSKE
jgi:hypothetical protein